MWVSHHCPKGLTGSPCPLLGGLHPEFAPGPADGRFAGQRSDDFRYLLVAQCRECHSVLGREPGLRRTIAWVPDEVVEAARRVHDQPAPAE